MSQSDKYLLINRELQIMSLDRWRPVASPDVISAEAVLVPAHLIFHAWCHIWNMWVLFTFTSHMHLSFLPGFDIFPFPCTLWLFFQSPYYSYYYYYYYSSSPRCGCRYAGAGVRCRYAGAGVRCRYAGGGVRCGVASVCISWQGTLASTSPSPVLLRRLSSLVRAAQQHFNPS